MNEKKVYLNEINSVPGSLAYYLFSETTQGFSDMLVDMLEVAKIRFAGESTIKKSYDSGILYSVGVKGSKHL